MCLRGAVSGLSKWGAQWSVQQPDWGDPKPLRPHLVFYALMAGCPGVQAL